MPPSRLAGGERTLQTMVLVVVLILVAAPILPILMQSVSDKALYDGGGAFSLRGYYRALGSPDFWSAVVNTAIFGCLRHVDCAGHRRGDGGAGRPHQSPWRTAGRQPDALADLCESPGAGVRLDRCLRAFWFRDPLGGTIARLAALGTLFPDRTFRRHRAVARAPDLPLLPGCCADHRPGARGRRSSERRRAVPDAGRDHLPAAAAGHRYHDDPEFRARAGALLHAAVARRAWRHAFPHHLHLRQRLRSDHPGSCIGERRGGPADPRGHVLVLVQMYLVGDGRASSPWAARLAAAASWTWVHGVGR